MDWKALIEARKSTRAYEPKPVDKKLLAEILEEAAYAPNAMHRNTWQFTALTDEKKIAELVDVVKCATGREDYTMYHPPVVVIVSDEKDDVNARENCACALTYLFLAAANRGLGSVWINRRERMRARVSRRNRRAEKSHRGRSRRDRISRTERKTARGEKSEYQNSVTFFQKSRCKDALTPKSWTKKSNLRGSFHGKIQLRIEEENRRRIPVREDKLFRPGREVSNG